MKFDNKKNVSSPLPVSNASVQPFPGWTKRPSMKKGQTPNLSLEVFGEPGSGKTHLAGTFPKPALCDTETKGWIVWDKFDNDRYFRAKNYYEIRSFVDHCLNDPDVETIVIDSSKDLRLWAEDATLDELNKKSLYSPANGSVLFSQCFVKLDNIINECRNAGKNLVFTSRMKDEYVRNEATGKRICDGYTKSWFQFEVVLQMVRGMVHTVYGLVLEDMMFAKVIKNGNMRPTEVRPYLIDVSYNGIMNELYTANPYLGSEDNFIEEAYKELTGHELSSDASNETIVKRV